MKTLKYTLFITVLLGSLNLHAKVHLWKHYYSQYSPSATYSTSRSDLEIHFRNPPIIDEMTTSRLTELTSQALASLDNPFLSKPPVIDEFFKVSSSEIDTLSVISRGYSQYLGYISDNVMPHLTQDFSNNFLAQFKLLRALHMETLIISYIESTYRVDSSMKAELQSRKLERIGQMGALSAFIMSHERSFRLYAPAPSSSETSLHREEDLKAFFQAVNTPFLYSLSKVDGDRTPISKSFNQHLRNFHETDLTARWALVAGTLIATPAVYFLDSTMSLELNSLIKASASILPGTIFFLRSLKHRLKLSKTSEDRLLKYSSSQAPSCKQIL